MEHPLRAEAAQHKWFHAIDLGAFQTSGRFPEGTPQNRTLFPAMDMLQYIDFRGLDCLDIGTAHGLSAFGMCLRGAKSVTATDVMDTISPPWALARKGLGLDVEYLTATTFENIMDRMNGRQFDVIVCAGVIYHMLNPYHAILKCRQLLKPNGLLLLESAYLKDEQRPIMDMNAHSGTLKELYTYWMPSRTAMIGMLQLVGFDPMAERSIVTPDRIAMIAKNVSWSDVSGRSDICIRMHETGLQAAEIGPDPAGPPSTVEYNGPKDVQVLDWATYNPNWPPHPKEMTDAVGKTVWQSTNKNY